MLNPMRQDTLLRDPRFRRFWLAQSLVYLGDMVSFIVLPLVALLSLDASTAQVGTLAALGPLPVLLLGTHVGAWVDRAPSLGAVMRRASVARAVALASVPAAAAAGVLTFAHLCGAAVLVGVAAVWFNVSAQTALPRLVERGRLVEANAATRMSFSLAAVVGPSVGGLLVSVIGAPEALLVDSAALALAAVLLSRVEITNIDADASAPSAASSDDGSVLAGLRAMRRDRRQVAILVGSATAAFAFTAYFTLLLVYATRELGLSAAQLGTALGVGAVGAVVGSALTGRISRRFGLGPTATAGAFLYTGVLLAVPLAPRDDPVVATIVIAVVEFTSAAALLVFEISQTSIQQAITPAGQLGRIRGANLAANYGARTLAGLAAGVIGTSFGTGTAMPAVVAVGILGAIWLWLSPVRAVRNISGAVVDSTAGSSGTSTAPC